ncbi:MAG: 3-hydroxyacyl-CoA dehydrogenase family protein [Anaerovoracaceae bacterium]|jgi:3-hydroxybutyryl-CoA dehydrogenase
MKNKKQTMVSPLDEQIAVYGCGAIGSSEATLIIGHGLPCTVIGHSQRGLERCRGAMAQHWDDLIAEGLASERNKEAALDLLTLTNEPAALAGCTFVFEAVTEDTKIKQEAYRHIETYAAADAVIASTTSSLDADVLAGLTGRPQQLLVAHPFQPVHMLPLVEVVRCGATAEETLARALAVLKTLHRQVVQLQRSVPGFIVNRFAQALFRESLYLIEEGVTTAAEIDRAVKYAVGMRYASIGLLEYFDDVGFDLEKSIAENVYPDLCDVKEPQQLVRDGLASGRTGKAAGQGLYDWSRIDQDDYRRRRQSPYFDTVREWTMPE